jgi:transcription initiation factor IIF auxiliary subunit
MNPNLENIIELFTKMQAEGWNTNGPLKFGFYFVDDNEEKLMKVYYELKDHDYVLEKIYNSTDDKKTLYISKIDTLTPEVLHKRNITFNELAEYCDVELFDGWDVEKI